MMEMSSLSTSNVKTHINQNTNTNSNVISVAAMMEQTLSAADKLRRFCYIGTFDVPLFVAPPLDVTKLRIQQHFPVLQELCTQVTQRQLVESLSDILNLTNADKLPRRDEALLVLAVYLLSCSDEKDRNSTRGYFAILVTSSKDLLIFVKHVKCVQSIMQRKSSFNRTIRKAVIDWYKLQSLDRLLELWAEEDSGHCSHRDILHACHYTNEKFDVDILAALRLIFTQDKDVLLWPDHLDPLIRFKDLILGVAKMRLANKPEETYPIIQQFGLRFQHVPRVLMSDPMVVNALLPKMTYEQLLLTCQKFLTVFKVNRTDQDHYLDMLFDDSKIRSANVEPIRMLMQDDLQIKRVVKRSRNNSTQPQSMINLYKRSFGLNKPIGLRLHITINMEKLYIGKYLHGRWRSIKYIDAVLAFAFGYYKTESQVNVQVWYDRSGKLKSLPWTPTMTVDEAKTCCLSQNIVKIKQALTDVIDNAEKDAINTYDAFLVLLPRATRGNPKNMSDKLYRRLNEYRQTRNPNAKFIIMSLRGNQRSMTYSQERKENILELCGISEEMPRLINAFANGKFV